MSTPVFPGADESTPSRAEYFSWINNTNEGPTESQTLANLAFFKYLHEQFGMTLDIYAFDAGAIDGARFYGSTDSERFRRQFPRGFGPAVDFAAAMNTRLGLWGGPDGFGNTPQQAAKRTEMMVSLCREFRFALFKFDGVCGKLPPANRPHFGEMMTQCRQWSPDLILLNHRLDLGEEIKHATTFLWEGAETYIDALMTNATCATHNRAVALARGVPAGLKRLCEDHGVCLSSCLDYWEDDLILQAFNRCLILAPQIYGNPWLLRDDELPRLRIYNLHRKFRDILVAGVVLPDAYGPHAVSRGDGYTRIITLRNLSWEPRTIDVKLSAEIGLDAAAGTPVHVRCLHPEERILSGHKIGDEVPVTVLPFRAAMLLVTTAPCDLPAVTGCAYEVIRDVPGRPVEIDLLGSPGDQSVVEFAGPATLDGREIESGTRVVFPGEPDAAPWHRKLADLSPAPVPADARALYEATCFAADSDAMEEREARRSGPSAIPEVRAARDAFFDQPLYRQRFLAGKFAFDDDPDTAFAVSRRWDRGWAMRVRQGAFRVDLTRPTLVDRFVIECGEEFSLAPLKPHEGIRAAVSADGMHWREALGFITTHIDIPVTDGLPVRYLTFAPSPERVRHVRAYRGSAALDRTGWRASNLLAAYQTAPAKHALVAGFTIDRIHPGAYLAVAIHGKHGNELAYAALRAGPAIIGSPRRSPSYPSNSWECPAIATAGNYTYYFPLTPDLAARPLEAAVLLLAGSDPDVRAEAWLTAYPIPRVRRRLVLGR